MKADPGSFRDRSNRVFVTDKAVFRALNATAKANWDTLSATKFYQRYAASGQIAATKEATLSELGGLQAHGGNWLALLEHERVPVISYPYEWSFGMLKDAALLHLDMMLEALAEGFVLKDATPFNVQFIGARATLIDVISFEKLGDDNIWVAHRQFCEMFLYPLMLQAYLKVPFHSWLRGSLDGITATDMAKLFSWRDYFRPGVLVQVILQSKLQQSFGSSTSNIRSELKTAGLGAELIKANVKKLRRIVQKLDSGIGSTEWGDYAANTSYSDSERTIKQAFIADVMRSGPWPLVWDLGCNTGDYAKIAAEHGAYVVAADGDHLAIERLYQEQKTKGGTTILPLVMKLNDQSPGLGWRGQERAPFAARSKPSVVFCLALIHHLVITANIPLPEVLAWFASLNAALVIEFVNKQDEMVRQLLRQRLDQYPDYTPAGFETALGEFFTIEKRCETKPGKREIFFARPKKGNC